MSSVHTKLSTTTKGSNVVLYRRLLFPSLPPSVDPPLLLQHGSPELNAELYDFVALALRAYITPWWSKITRYDREFVPHVAYIIGVVMRALEARLLDADIPELLFRAVPTLLSQHFADYRAASAKVGTSYALGGAATLPHLFHQLQGHMAIDAQGQIDPEYIRHTLDLILQACLPPEDYGSDAERAIIREVIVKVLLGDVVPLLVQPWFIHKQLLDIVRSNPEKSASPVKQDSTPSPVQSSRPSFHTLIVRTLSAIQYLSGLSLVLMQMYKQMKLTVKKVNAIPEVFSSNARRDYAVNLVDCCSEVLDTRARPASDAALDILKTVATFMHYFLDKLLIYSLQTYLLTEQRVLMVVKLSKQTLFPNGYPGPPPTIPSPEEQALLKEELVQQLEQMTLPFVSALILGPKAKSRETILASLAPLSSDACNAHLVLFLLDLIVAALFPELAAKIPSEGVESASLRSRVSSSDDVEGDLQSP